MSNLNKYPTKISIDQESDTSVIPVEYIETETPAPEFVSDVELVNATPELLDEINDALIEDAVAEQHEISNSRHTRKLILGRIALDRN